MKAHVPIEHLGIGMFVEAEVLSMLVGEQVRHFLKPVEAKYSTTKALRLRLSARKQGQINNAGGMLMGSEKQIQALREIGVSEVLVNTDKCDVVPDLPEPAVGKGESAERSSPQSMPSSVRTEGGGYRWLTPGGETAEWVYGQTPATEPASETRKAKSAGPRQSLGAQDTEKRRNFGPSNTGWMKIDTTPDNNQAFVQILSFGGDATLGAEDVFAALEELYGIVIGLDREMVQRLSDQAASSPARVIRGNFLIAAISESELDKIGSIEYTFMADLPEGLLEFDELYKGYNGESVGWLVKGKPQVRVVGPGWELARFTAGDGEEGGRDIFGDLRPMAGAESVLGAGCNVEVVDEQYVAQVYGYVCLHENEFSVFPPIWVSADHMKAYYVHLPRITEGPALTQEWLDQILKVQEVLTGLDEGELEKVITSPPGDTLCKSVMIAEGEPPEHGEDARIKFTFDTTDETGIQEDGSIDLDARDNASWVEVDGLLADVIPAIEGVSGHDLADREIEGESGEPSNLQVGDNVRSEFLNKTWCYFATVEGCARLRDDVLSVHQILYHEGNVDNDMVFDDATKDVRIKGSVRAGVNVKAAKSLSVDGIIEGGASVQAAGDIVVGKGVIGYYTKVVSLGSVETKFVQQGTVVAQGDVNITSNLLNARVRAGGRFAIKGDGGEKGGAVVGGEIFASKGLDLGQVGSPTVEGTTIGIAADPKLTAKMKKLEDGIDFCKTNILRIFRTLGMTELNVAHFKKLIEKNPPNKRKPMMKVLGQLKTLAENREKSAAAHKQVEKELVDSLREAEIRISEIAYAGVKIQIGTEVLTLDKNEEDSVFKLGPSGTVTWTKGTQDE